MKENVICGHLIPAGTGQAEFEKIVVASREEYEKIMEAKRNVIDVNVASKESEKISE
jgi:DNA-directed RNA polymerase subunit beta'